MKTTKTKHKCTLLLIGAWLMTKLAWTLEMSRLAVFRWIPKARVQYVIKLPVNRSITEWIYIEDDSRCYVWHRGGECSRFFGLPQINKN
ncbi:hypothetical protein JXJ21_17680 [candidate division KSB1 bacterium]|nr:hypothetical protein [candidate division KSB1 bacterium]